jgi:hypothetical protein
MFALACWLTVFILSLSSIVYASSAICWNRFGKVIYEKKIKDMLYSTDNPSIIWVKDKNNNDVFIQNLECLIILDQKNIQKHHSK